MKRYGPSDKPFAFEEDIRQALQKCGRDVHAPEVRATSDRPEDKGVVTARSLFVRRLCTGVLSYCRAALLPCLAWLPTFDAVNRRLSCYSSRCEVLCVCVSMLQPRRARCTKPTSNADVAAFRGRLQRNGR